MMKNTLMRKRKVKSNDLLLVKLEVQENKLLEEWTD